MKVISDITYRIHCEEATSARQRRQMRLFVQFNRLKPHRVRPTALQAFPQEDNGVSTEGIILRTALRGEVIEGDDSSDSDSDSDDHSQFGTSRYGGVTGGTVAWTKVDLR